MGAMLRYRCGACGYEAELSVGVGFAGIDSDVFLCRDCRELVAANVKNLQTGRKLKPRCPNSRKHVIEPWNEPGPCPRCGAAGVRGEYVGCWD
jgi:rubrerythrin